jgi:hypothetical protein
MDDKEMAVYEEFHAKREQPWSDEARELCTEDIREDSRLWAEPLKGVIDGPCETPLERRQLFVAALARHEGVLAIHYHSYWERRDGPPPNMEHFDQITTLEQGTEGMERGHFRFIDGDKFVVHGKGGPKQEPHDDGDDRDTRKRKWNTWIAPVPPLHTPVYEGYEDWPDHPICPTIATSATAGETHHWRKRSTTYDFPTWMYFGRNDYSFRELILGWNRLTKITRPQCARGINTGKRAEKTQEINKMKREATCWLTAHNFNLDEIKKLDKHTDQLYAMMRAVGSYIQTTHFRMGHTTISAMPICEDRDDKNAMYERTEFDERLTLPMDALLTLQNKAVQDYYNKSSKQYPTGMKRTAHAEKTYRCGAHFWIVTTDTGTKKPNTRIGPYECGRILNARSDWEFIRGGRANKNNWHCKHCYGNWSKAVHGQWSVQVYDGVHILVLILDFIPDDLHLRWQKNRIAYYTRAEPRAACRNEKPTIPEGAQTTYIRLQGADSEKMWNILLADLDTDYSGGAQNKLPIEPKTLLTEVQASDGLETLNKTHAHILDWISEPIDGDTEHSLRHQNIEYDYREQYKTAVIPEELDDGRLPTHAPR